jgi:hypothetical protein
MSLMGWPDVVNGMSLMGWPDVVNGMARCRGQLLLGLFGLVVDGVDVDGTLRD